MEDFADVSRARASYQAFAKAMNAGREIMKRAGVADPPSIPEFDVVFRRLDAPVRQELYALLRERDQTTGQDAIRIWTPFVKRAFGAGTAPS